jgi:serine protease SohB
MSPPVADYLLFLAQTVTLALAAIGTVAGTMAAVTAVRHRTRRRPRVEVTDLGLRYDQLRLTMQEAVLPRRAMRRELKAHQHRVRALDKAKADAVTRNPERRRPRVFVLDFKGDTQASAVTALREEITAVLSVAGTDDEVVVRLENPGGIVHDQGLAASQLQRLRQRGIRLTVAVDKVAASGGYLMACVADRIIAAPFALIGSIGVIAVIPNVHQLLNRHGVAVEQFTGGEFKRTVTPYGEPTEAARAKLTEEIQDVHALFKEFVATHRPGIDLDRVTTGEAWHGSRALELALVDEISTSDDYLLTARDRADLYLVGCREERSMQRQLIPRLVEALSGLLR